MRVLFMCTASCRSILFPKPCSTTWPRRARGMQRRQPAQRAGASAQPGDLEQPASPPTACTARAAKPSKAHRRTSSSPFATPPRGSLPAVSRRAALKAHGAWPSSAPDGDEALRDAAFHATLARIEQRCRAFLGLPSLPWIATSSSVSWAHRLALTGGSMSEQLPNRSRAARRPAPSPGTGRASSCSTAARPASALQPPAAGAGGRTARTLRCQTRVAVSGPPLPDDAPVEHPGPRVARPGAVVGQSGARQAPRCAVRGIQGADRLDSPGTRAVRARRGQDPWR